MPKTKRSHTVGREEIDLLIAAAVEDEDKDHLWAWLPLLPSSSSFYWCCHCRFPKNVKRQLIINCCHPHMQQRRHLVSLCCLSLSFSLSLSGRNLLVFTALVVAVAPLYAPCRRVAVPLSVPLSPLSPSLCPSSVCCLPGCLCLCLLGQLPSLFAVAVAGNAHASIDQKRQHFPIATAEGSVQSCDTQR